MLLYRQDGSSLAREVNSLYPLEHGRLWLVDADSQSQLHGDLDNLAPVTADSVRQLLQQHPVDGACCCWTPTPDVTPRGCW